MILKRKYICIEENRLQDQQIDFSLQLRLYFACIKIFCTNQGKEFQGLEFSNFALDFFLVSENPWVKYEMGYWRESTTIP